MACLLAAPVVADTIDADPEAGYVPIEELSYETIIRPGRGFEAELALRIALHNPSTRAHDAVLALALPRESELVGLAIHDGGDWIEGELSKIAGTAGVPGEGRRDPGSVFVRPLEPVDPRDLPGAELAVFEMAPEATMQVELRLRVHPVLRNSRWQLELPRRNSDSPNLMDRRRVVVQGLPSGDEFWVDEVSNGGTPYMVTPAENAITVSWPAHRTNKAQLDGSYEISRDPDGQGGRVRLVLRLGPSKRAKPDHVILLVDRSQSGASTLPRESARMFSALLDSLPSATTFDAITFAREAEGLIDPARIAAGKAPRADDEEARAELEQSLEVTVSGQGTDLRAAMELAGQRIAASSARRPLVLVVTDGMLPPSVGADAVDRALSDQLGRKDPRPEILFVVDDPLLNVRGLPADHPIASLAANLGARISLETLANLDPAEIGELLAAPQVLGKLDVSLPATVILDEPLPTGLVAGDFVVLEGSYGGRAPSKLTVRGRLGKSEIATTFKSTRRDKLPAALAAALREGDRARATQEGFALPEWYTTGMRRVATMNLSQAGKVGWQATGQLDASIIQRQLRTRVLPRARACYNQALTRNGVLSGQVQLKMEAGKGEIMMASVEGSELSHPDSRLLECLERAAWQMDVPAGRLDTQIYVINYPLEFAAPEGGHPPRTGERSDPNFEQLIQSAEALADYQNNLE